MTAGVRRRSTRSLIARELDVVNKRVQWMRANWVRVSRQVYDRPEGAVQSQLRARRPDEYPENDAEKLAALISQCRAARFNLFEVERFAEARLDQLREGAGR